MKTLYIILALFLASCSDKPSKLTDSDKLPNKFERPDSNVPVIGVDRDTSWAPFDLKYSFNAFHVRIYAGNLAKPDFTSVEYGNDKHFREFIRERLKGMAINFGGKYTIVEKSCGAMCVVIYMIDRITGKIFSFPTKGDGHWGYRYHPNSHLLVGNSEVLNDKMNMYLDRWKIDPEFYRWTGTKFELLK